MDGNIGVQKMEKVDSQAGSNINAEMPDTGNDTIFEPKQKGGTMRFILF